MSLLKNILIGPSVYAQRDSVTPVSTITPAGISSPSIEDQLQQGAAQAGLEIQQSICNDNPLKQRKTETNTCECRYGIRNEECMIYCPQGYVKDNDGNNTNECLVNNAGNLGIDCNPTQLANGTCTRNINKTLGIRESAGSQPVTPTMFIQDIVLTATGFVGTVMMIALLVMGGKYVMGGFDESSTGDLKTNMKKLLIGLLLIISSYTVIKIIQYIARGS